MGKPLPMRVFLSSDRVWSLAGGFGGRIVGIAAVAALFAIAIAVTVAVFAVTAAAVAVLAHALGGGIEHIAQKVGLVVRQLLKAGGNLHY